MARVLPIHEFVMTRDKKQAAVEKNSTVTVTVTAAGNMLNWFCNLRPV
jgi:hypothetical protein